jgi:hypothetical protein
VNSSRKCDDEGAIGHGGCGSETVFPGLAPVVTVECGDGAWAVFWDEPAGGVDWEAYTRAAETVLIPAMQAQWPAWKQARATARSVVLMKSPHGLIRGITEACARDVVALIQRVFPQAVVSWLPEFS